MIDAVALRRSFGPKLVLDGVDLHVARASLTGLIGSNGAGKTTTIDILTGLAQPDAGTVTVAGRRPADARRLLGYAPQHLAIYTDLTVRENLAFLARCYGDARVDVPAVAARVGLGACIDTPAAKLSGGQQRLLNLALALAHAPEVLILDEPTVGLDIEARSLVWELLRELRAGGTTILFTTHYLEEAERLCDAVAILADGRIVAEGRPDALIAQLDFAAVVTVESAESERAAAALARYAREIRNGGTTVRATVATLPSLAEMVAWLDGVPCSAIAAKPATLEDVYLRAVRMR